MFNLIQTVVLLQSCDGKWFVLRVWSHVDTEGDEMYFVKVFMLSYLENVHQASFNLNPI